jgi:hypothetical protein
MGTVSGRTMEARKEKYVFHHDERLYDTLPDMYVFDFDFEPRVRPTDAEVRTINELIMLGS